MVNDLIASCSRKISTSSLQNGKNIFLIQFEISIVESTISFTRVAESAILGSIIPTSFSTNRVILTLSEDSYKISEAKALLPSANLRTSAATTENPRHCSPALAASTAAFNAKIFVWKAISFFLG
jgi:hypothetical protein